jgi:hypothetical protein
VSAVADEVPTQPVDAQPDVAGDDVDALRAERDALQAQVSSLERRSRWRSRLRTIGVVVLIVLACVSFEGAVVGVWAKRNLLDTDRLTETFQEIVTDPDVEQAVSVRLTAALTSLIRPEEVLEDALPDRADILAVPLANAVERFIASTVDRFVGSDAYERIMVGLVERAHAGALRVLRGESEFVEIVDGTVVLDLVPVINAVLAQITSVSPEIFGRTINLPDITVEDVPEQARERLADALGVSLDEDFGRVPVFESDSLTAAQDALWTFERAVPAFVLATLAFAGLALWLSRRRRRTLLQLVVGLALVLVLLRRVLYRLVESVTGIPDNEVGQAAAHSVVTILLDSLFLLTVVLLIVLALVAIVALVTGSYPWAVALRRRSGELAAAGTDPEKRPAWLQSGLSWAAVHHDWLAIGGAVVAVLILLVFDLSWIGLIVLAALVVAYEVGVNRLGRTAATDAAGA